MRVLPSLAVALALSLPGVASAQYTPIATDGSVPYGYAARRSPWYIGFGVGTGDGSVTYGSQNYSFYDWHDAAGTGQAPVNGMLNFKLGATLSQALLLGFDLTALGSQLDDGALSTTLRIENFDAVATWFPQGEGFFLKGGAGLSEFRQSFSDAYGSAAQSYGGTNVLVGVGYALWLGYRFNLVLNADFSVQWYKKSDLGPDSTRFFALWVGFDWY